MFRRPHAQILTTLAAFVTLASLRASPPEAASPAVFQVGMMASLFDESDENTVRAQMQPFVDLVKKQTGMAAEFHVIKTVDQLSADLKSGKLSLGVVLGLDYGWLRETCPEAEPLIIAVNETHLLKAVVLVHKEHAAKTVADLKGKSFALPTKTPRFLKFYLERDVQAELPKFFRMKEQANTDAAIEAVVEGEADATVVTSTALDVYRQRKPGRFNRLKVLQESVDFPTGALVYIPGKVKEATLDKFRAAMLKTHQTAEGQQTLTLWRLTGFQEPPKDFIKQVDELAKKYPRAAK